MWEYSSESQQGDGPQDCHPVRMNKAQGGGEEEAPYAPVVGRYLGGTPSSPPHLGISRAMEVDFPEKEESMTVQVEEVDGTGLQRELSHTNRRTHRLARNYKDGMEYLTGKVTECWQVLQNVAEWAEKHSTETAQFQSFTMGRVGGLQRQMQQVEEELRAVAHFRQASE